MATEQPNSLAQWMPENARLDVYDDGYFRIEHDNYYVACGGVCLKLSVTEFLLLSRLARSPYRVVSPEELWRYACRNKSMVNGQSLRVLISHIRHRLEPFGLTIENLVSAGYRLVLKNPPNNDPTKQ